MPPHHYKMADPAALAQDLVILHVGILPVTAPARLAFRTHCGRWSERPLYPACKACGRGVWSRFFAPQRFFPSCFSLDPLLLLPCKRELKCVWYSSVRCPRTRSRSWAAAARSSNGGFPVGHYLAVRLGDHHVHVFDATLDRMSSVLAFN